MSKTSSLGGPSANVTAALLESVRQVAERIPRLRSQGARISEQDTKSVLITPTIQALGWDILDIDEVRNEYRHKPADNPVDYALFLNRSPVLFVEAKPLSNSLSDRKWIIQTLNYANAAGVDWCVLTNGAEYRFYKVHAQVEADQKLFASVVLDDPDALPDVIRVLSLIGRENMRARAIDDLWQAWHVDSQVKAALEHVLQDDSFVTIVRKGVPQIAMADVRKSLQRANITVSYQNIFPTTIAEAPISQGAAGGAKADLLTISPSVQSDPPHRPVAGTERPRRQFQSTQDLFDGGKIKAGDPLTIRGRAGSLAYVVDGRTVDFDGKQVSYLEWGKRVTGWKAVQIYTQAVLSDGRTLDQLRDEPQAKSVTPE